MGACCFKPSVNEDVVEAQSASTAAGDRGRGRAGRAAGRGAPDAPGPGNKLLCRKAPVWSSETPMTMGQLKSKRDEFWDTEPAFHGRAEIWQALKAAAECEDAETAQAIISAISVTFPPVGKRTEQHACSLARTHHSYVREHATSSLPQGNLSVVYDQLGNKYDIPPYCLSEPVNLVKENGEAPQTSVPPTSATSAENKAEEGACDAPAAPPVGLKIKIRLSTQQELLWSGPPDTSVAVLKRFVQEQESIAPERQRFLFGGQLLQDSKTLAQAKVPSNCVVQVMVNPASDD